MFNTLIHLLAISLLSVGALAQIDTYVGDIKIWPGSYAPRGWAFCNGQLLSVSSNQVLFLVISNRYGGDGINNFALPNMQGVLPMGVSSQYPLASRGGGAASAFSGAVSGTVSLTTANLPPHTHEATFEGQDSSSIVDTAISVAQQPGQAAAQAGGSLSQGANSGGNAASIFLPPNANVANRVNLAGGSTTVTTSSAGTVQVDETGQGEPVALNLPFSGAVVPGDPRYLALNYIIAITGIFPSQNN